jgi:hypothetical protein
VVQHTRKVLLQQLWWGHLQACTPVNSTRSDGRLRVAVQDGHSVLFNSFSFLLYLSLTVTATLLVALSLLVALVVLTAMLPGSYTLITRLEFSFRCMHDQVEIVSGSFLDSHRCKNYI